MDENALFGGTLDLAVKSLNLRARRHKVIISNLANADTPDYKAFDLMVDEALGKRSAAASGLEMQRTHSGHLPTAVSASRGPSPQVVKIEAMNNLRGDGNTVDMDREMANLAENQLMYRTSARIASKKLQGLKNVIQGGRR
jgi:flagellar basal-body rod protein FlgB